MHIDNVIMFKGLLEAGTTIKPPNNNLKKFGGVLNHELTPIFFLHMSPADVFHGKSFRGQSSGKSCK